MERDRRNKALFLDRDGVINVDTGYVHAAGDFVLVPGILELCRHAADKGYLIVTVTNQSGIGRGMFGEEDFAELTRHMRGVFERAGCPIHAVFHCPSADDGDWYRKPNPGMFLQAKEQCGLDMAQSVSVGDKERDILAAFAAGVGRNYLYATHMPPNLPASGLCARLTDLIPLL